MMIAARNAMMMRGGAPLPYDSEVEYLASTGTEYVNLTNAFGGHTIVATIKWCPLSTTSNKFIFGGGQNSSPQTRVGVNGSSNPFVTPNGDTAYIYINNKSAITEQVNGQHLTVVTASLTPQYVFAFCQEWRRVPDGIITARLLGLTITENDATAMDFIPVRVGSGSSARGYLYDRANPTGGPQGNGLYGNAADGQGGVTGFEQFGADK